MSLEEEDQSGAYKTVRYFFTLLRSFIKKDGKSGKRKHRRSGFGLWKEERSKDIKVGFRVLGYERYFKYKPDDKSGVQGNNEDSIEWRMYEFLFVDNQEFAICRITKVIKKENMGSNDYNNINIVLPAIQQEVTSITSEGYCHDDESVKNVTICAVESLDEVRPLSSMDEFQEFAFEKYLELIDFDGEKQRQEESLQDWQTLVEKDGDDQISNYDFWKQMFDNATQFDSTTLLGIAFNRWDGLALISSC